MDTLPEIHIPFSSNIAIERSVRLSLRSHANWVYSFLYSIGKELIHMHRYSIGTPVVSAIIRTKTAGEVTAVTVAKGDALTDLTVVSYPENIVLPSATVRGFTLKSLSMPRNSSTVYDGIPTYMPDPDGGSYFGTAEEVTEIDKILVDVPAATEG